MKILLNREHKNRGHPSQDLNYEPVCANLQGMDVYQLKIALRGISPMVWRRLKVAGNTDLAYLHTIFQLAMGWKDYHLHTYRIYAKDYGACKPGGMLFADYPKKVLLPDFHFRTGDRFEYAYDFTAGWVQDIRIEAVESKDTETFDPMCTGGASRRFLRQSQIVPSWRNA